MQTRIFVCQTSNGFDPNAELLSICETFSFLIKMSRTLAILRRSEAGLFQ